MTENKVVTDEEWLDADVTPTDLKNSFQDERKFLHDISNNLTIASGMLEVTMDIWEDSEDEVLVKEKDLERLKKSRFAMDVLASKLRARRAVLIARGGEEDPVSIISRQQRKS